MDKLELYYFSDNPVRWNGEILTLPYFKAELLLYILGMKKTGSLSNCVG